MLFQQLRSSLKPLMGTCLRARPYTVRVRWSIRCRCVCSSFKETSTSLCDAIAGVAKQRICTQPVSRSGLNALLACHLVPLDKNSGVHPIGVAQRIVCKTTNGPASSEPFHSVVHAFSLWRMSSTKSSSLH